MREPNKTKILRRDNVFRGKKWGNKGEEIRVISINGCAVIYENTKGERYPCNIKDLE